MHELGFGAAQQWKMLCLAWVGMNVDSIAHLGFLVNSQELDPGVSRDVLAAYLQVTSSQGSEGTVGSSVN